ncbi:MAG: hypothetical protein HMLKMBBP_03834 [Planctomycetes bacterium]|nr:hypothetical protein [Planctomycetota bacterium]
MTPFRAVLRVLLASAVAFAISIPFASVRSTAEAGFTFDLRPAGTIAGVVAAAAILGELVRLAGRYLGPGAPRDARPPFALPAKARGAALAAAALLVALVPLWSGSGTVTMATEAMIFAVIAVGLQITIGMAGLLVLGHAGFWAVGAYTYGLLTIHLGWSFWPAMAAGGVAAAAMGFMVGLPALRLRGDYLAVVTLGFGEAVRAVLKNENKWTGGDANLPSNLVPGQLRGVQGEIGQWIWQPYGTPGRNGDYECYLTALGLLALCIFSVVRLARSREGRALFALREDETAAKCMGVDTVRTKLLAFTSSAMWAGLAGALTAVQRDSLNPELFDFNTSILFVAMVVLGGLGSVAGAVLGAGALWILPPLLQDWFEDITLYRPLVIGALMAGMMVVRPEGLLGSRSRKAAG